ncbi:glutamate-cysteine ligase family protein [Psychroserpens sp. Hel_I_66]|uniref:glutamate-cysteine ligase family protein n=1 Tax=Psychroserpens sp. Hel_I_66 TaxID=1250004 RepID=UPI0006485226|nr:glutamate-cysteine ligase family protein [Psychroserpens sp. Hel_I_66]
MSKRYHLFEVFGIELEYMLVNNSNFKVSPTVDKLLSLKNGELTSDIDNGDIAWSNELVAHVVELKTNGPTEDLEKLSEKFHENIIEINHLLKQIDAQLLPTASHPLMNPLTDTQLWKHSYSEVYELYNRIFDCKGHGWSNVQSTHINLPFYDDEEFEKLHAAIRILLPLIPGLCASSPILEGKTTAFLDSRLEYYKINQKEIPEMTGTVIPEQVFSKSEYQNIIFEPIKKAIKPFDTNKILDHHFLNSRGAIARFDRNAIEIRLVDVQECAKADIAICIFIIEVLKALVNEEFCDLKSQKQWKKEDLFEILNDGIKYGELSKVENLKYLSLFGIKEKATMQDIWTHVFNNVKDSISSENQKIIAFILNNGTLSSRILKAIDEDFSEENIKKTYSQLAECLQNNELFKP